MGLPSNGHVLNMVLTTSDRSQVIRSFNTAHLTQRKITPFRALTNSGDILGRTNYTCGGPDQLANTRRRQSLNMFRGGVRSNCDESGIPGASCNPKYVYDSSTYSRYKRLLSTQRAFNDTSFGGANNGAQSVSL